MSKPNNPALNTSPLENTFEIARTSSIPEFKLFLKQYKPNFSETNSKKVMALHVIAGRDDKDMPIILALALGHMLQNPQMVNNSLQTVDLNPKHGMGATGGDVLSCIQNGPAQPGIRRKAGQILALGLKHQESMKDSKTGSDTLLGAEDFMEQQALQLTSKTSPSRSSSPSSAVPVFGLSSQRNLSESMKR